MLLIALLLSACGGGGSSSDMPPPNQDTLSYTGSKTLTVGTAASITPQVSGMAAVTSWSVSPSLPAGLSLNSTTGAISGTPTAAASASNYTVTAQY